MQEVIRSIDFVFLNKQRTDLNGTLGNLYSTTDGSRAVSISDSTLMTETDSNDYEIIPGKLTP